MLITMRHLEEAAQGSLPLDDGAPQFEPQEPPPGFQHLPGFLDEAGQRDVLAAVLRAIEDSPWYTPTMPRSGRPFSVRMSNLGQLGWISDRSGYRYEALHPDTGRPWAPIPAEVLHVWEQVAGYPHPPECCLVNLYSGGAKMGLHQDRDEAELAAPVVSISLGDSAVFRVGGTSRRGRTAAMTLASGDVVVVGGPARLCFHGIDRVLAGTSSLVPGGGRINLTLRRVTRPEEGGR
jgi:alkylated DNA repair protein (DNA oxidative demethylase)